MSLYEGRLDLYKDISEYNMIDVLDQSQMVGYGVEDDAAIDFDKLNPSKFKECYRLHHGPLPGGTQQQKQKWKSPTFCRLHKREALPTISPSMVCRNRR